MNKKVKLILIILGIMIVIWYSFVGVVKYMNWKWYEGMKKEAVKFEKEMVDKEAKIMSDTYGGKTPQETLALFIEAVEDGDYELASKYFVVERQWEELKSLRESEKENIDNVMSLLKKANTQMIKENFQTSKSNYIVTDPILVTFIKYPSNLWKIDEI